ncbi:phosphoribosyltransferase [Trichocoleus sp. FACHB-591]|uniref:phosphoribosyltransferase n=1 Tax=Trichocoleus sp. FACHB-591 TaxID=2692872 RepID=UPI001683AE37|nr:phosphoribosyltransferase family protein [Trichocoleus sp. FACHB-591]MBD2093821.1 phosphoribosyltransferase [Trichocoleus sp. FACHB-591]
MLPSPLFRDREAAGHELALAVFEEFSRLKTAATELDWPTLATAQPIVYGLPRGGIPVAAAIAEKLNCPLDVVIAKKITRPEDPELAIGAVAATGEVLWTQPRPWHLHRTKIYQAALQATLEKAQLQLTQFGPIRPQVEPQGAIAILVDDGIATGMTIAVAAQALRQQQPAQIWICAPVAPLELVNWLHQWCDRLILLATPADFSSVSRFYQNFPQVELDEAIACLQNQSHARLPAQMNICSPRSPMLEELERKCSSALEGEREQ